MNVTQIKKANKIKTVGEYVTALSECEMLTLVVNRNVSVLKPGMFVGFNPKNVDELAAIILEEVWDDPVDYVDVCNGIITINM